MRARPPAARPAARRRRRATASMPARGTRRRRSPRAPRAAPARGAPMRAAAACACSSWCQRLSKPPSSACTARMAKTAFIARSHGRAIDDRVGEHARLVERVAPQRMDHVEVEAEQAVAEVGVRDAAGAGGQQRGHRQAQPAQDQREAPALENKRAADPRTRRAPCSGRRPCAPAGRRRRPAAWSSARRAARRRRYGSCAPTPCRRGRRRTRAPRSARRSAVALDSGLPNSRDSSASTPADRRAAQSMRPT